MNSDDTFTNKPKLVFIGAVNHGNRALCGETAKNQALITHLSKLGCRIVMIDTFGWKRTPRVLLRVIYHLLVNRERTLIISAATNSVYKLIKLIRIFPRKGIAYYFVVGGNFAQCMHNGRYSSEPYKLFTKIFVQGKQMVNSLQESGLTNVEYLPNFRSFPGSAGEVDYNGILGAHRVIKLVFVSRIHESKGVFLLLNAMEQANTKNYLLDRYTVEFWGPIDHTIEAHFRSRLESLPNAHYMGVLDTQSVHGYSTLSQYDAMIFPTHWVGEGFPGVVIDAFVAGLPILASKWNLNTEIIEDGVLGILFEPKDETALVQALVRVINDPELLRAMSHRCKEESLKYHTDSVLGRINFYS